MDISVVITTRNRQQDVVRAIESCLCQTGVTSEVLVYVDNSDDNTAEVIKELYPTVRLFDLAERRGLIVNRNQGFLDALGVVVFSLDDDAYFTDRETLLTVFRRFQDPEIGAVAATYIEPHERRSKSSQAVSFSLRDGAAMRSYIGCAHAVRRSAAVALGGYRGFFIHQREEPEFCLRLWGRGFRVVYLECAPIVHLVRRSSVDPRVMFYGARNVVLSEFLMAPVPDIFWRLPGSAARLLLYSPRLGLYKVRFRGILAGVSDLVLHYWNERVPVSRSIYRAVRKLPGHGPIEHVGEIPEPCGNPEK